MLARLNFLQVLYLLVLLECALLKVALIANFASPVAALLNVSRTPLLRPEIVLARALQFFLFPIILTFHLDSANLINNLTNLHKLA